MEGFDWSAILGIGVIAAGVLALIGYGVFTAERTTTSKAARVPDPPPTKAPQPTDSNDWHSDI